MGSLVDYDQHYVLGPEQCGQPFGEFVSFFADYPRPQADVLDLGCGQGRDAIMAARHGHHVLGVDLSKVGINQLLEQSAAEGLNVEAVVSDVVNFNTQRKFDVVMIDRVLHCLPNDDERHIVLNKACRATRAKGHILIADTPKHLAQIRGYFAKRTETWRLVKGSGNYTFVERGGDAASATRKTARATRKTKA